MTRQFSAPAPFTDKPYQPIPMVPVESNQVKAIGYDTDTKTLAVTFTRGPGHIYHYPNVEPEVHADFMAAESKGNYFGQHIKSLAFDKFPAQEQREKPAA
ncbi:MAG: KTSC domain-containing protein [Alicycliphilus denitrificans]|nr:KTSC domain-containing protein [Alicycliphilus denitrificans]OJW82849.1 MAG: KTSC domain-containing protein [Alicycliphilus sp. 69-12]